MFNRLVGFALAAIAITAAIGPRLSTVDASTDKAVKTGHGPASAGAGRSSAWAASSGDEAMVLHRDGSGQFHLNAEANGHDVRFLVDTGADVVALTEETAQELGLAVGEMQPIMQTASGVGYGAPVTIDELVVAGTELRNVDAIVAQGLPIDLLGQSALRKLGSVSLQGDRMVIAPRGN